MFRVRCPQCREIVTLEDSTAGGLIKCPACDVEFEVPERRPKAAVPARPPRRAEPEAEEDECPAEPRLPKKKRRASPRMSLGDSPWTRNRIGGIVGIVVGLLVVVVGLSRGVSGGGAYQAGQIVGMISGGVLLIAGISAVIRG